VDVLVSTSLGQSRNEFFIENLPLLIIQVCVGLAACEASVCYSLIHCSWVQFAFIQDGFCLGENWVGRA